MKRFLTILAGGLLLPATIVTSSQAQIKFEGLKLTNSSGSYSLQGPATGTGTYVFPSLAGATGTLLSSDAGQSILGQLSLGLNGASGVAGKLTILDGLNTGSSGNITWGTGAFTLSGGISTPAAKISGFSTIGLVHNDASGVLSTSAIDLAGGVNEVTGLLAPANGGTGVNNGTNTLTISGGNITLSSAAGSSVTLPATGTLLSTASALSSSAAPGLTLTNNAPQIQFADGKSLTFADNSGPNTLMTLTDNGTTGTLSVNAITVAGLTASRVVKTDASSNLTTGAVNLASTNEVSGLLAPANGGTGVNNGTSTLTYGGNVNLGANAITFTTGGATTLTLPTSGTLLSDASALTSSASPGLSLTNATLPKIQVTDTKGLAISDGTQALMTLTDNGTTGTLSVNAITVPGLTASRVVRTDASNTLTTGQVDLASTNDITGLVSPTNGGTGVNNGTKTVTLSGTGNFTFNTAAGSSVTVPASGTLLSDASALTSSATPGISLTSASPKLQVTDAAGLLITDAAGNTLVTIADNGTNGTLTANGITSSNVTLSGGTINGTTVGLTTPARGSFASTAGTAALTSSATGANATNTAITLAASGGTANKALTVTAGDVTIGDVTLTTTTGSPHTLTWPTAAGQLALLSDVSGASLTAANTWTNTNTYSSATPITLSNAAPVITLSTAAAPLVVKDASANTLLTLADNGTTGTLSVTNVGVNTTASLPTNVRLAIKDGHIQSQQSGTTTLTKGSTLGSTATASLANATDVAGSITATCSGAGFGKTNIMTVNFATSYVTPPIVILTEGSADAFSKNVYVSSVTVNGFNLSTTTNVQNADAYTVYYFVIETQ